MITMPIIASLRMHLIQTIADSCENAQLHSVAFAARILGENVIPQLLTRLTNASDELAYGGYPEVASIGFRIGLKLSDRNTEKQFIDGAKRLRERPMKALNTLAADDVAILGIADGLSKINQASNADEIKATQEWLLEFIDSLPEKRIWTSRARDLAGDLLDNRGRLRISPTLETYSARVLEINLRDIWPYQFSQSAPLSMDNYKELFSELLSNELPDVGQLEEAVVWLKAIDLLVKRTSEALFPESKLEREACIVLSTIKTRLDEKANKQAKCNIWMVVAGLTMVWCILALLIWILTWTVMEPLTFIIGGFATVGGYIYFAITQKEISPRGIYEHLIESKRQKLYVESGFELETYKKLIKDSEMREDKEE